MDRTKTRGMVTVALNRSTGVILESEFVKLHESDGSWGVFEKDWREQCERIGEDFDSFAGLTFSVVKDLVHTENGKAGLYALRMEGSHVAMCQLNYATIPGYQEPVIRTRFITLSPTYDLTDVGEGAYSKAMIDLLYHVIRTGALDKTMKTRHVKFHLRSPADKAFFTAVGRGLNESDVFESVKTIGQWLHVSIAE